MIAGPALQITEPMILSTNVAASALPAYSSASTYRRLEEVTFQNYIFRSLQDANTGNQPPDENTDDWWVRVGAVEKFKPFEHDLRRVRLYDQCTNPEVVTFALKPGQRFDMLGFFNLSGQSLQVVMTDPSAGEVYRRVIGLDDRSGVRSFWDWWFPEFETAREKVLFDIPPFANATVEISIFNPGGTAGVGQIVLSKQIDFGRTVFGTEIKNRDYGTYEKDVNGQYTTYVPRGGSVRSGAVELFLAGVERQIDDGAEFAVHSWLDNHGREADDFAADDPAHRMYLDYYVEMGMTQKRASDFYAMTNSVPHSQALWLVADDMRYWLRPVERSEHGERAHATKRASERAKPVNVKIAYSDVSGVSLAQLSMNRIALAQLDSRLAFP